MRNRKKLGLVFIGMLWVAAMLPPFQKNQKEDEKIIEVFGSVGTMAQTSVVEYYGIYNKSFLELDEREEFLHKVAAELGITTDMSVTRSYENGKQETKLTKEANQASTVLRFLTVEKEGTRSQYMIMNITMNSEVGDALVYRKKLDKIMQPYSSHNKSSANVIGTYQGRLSLAERNKVADALLKEMGARVVTENRDMKLYTIYAYTPWISEYEMQENQAVNINIAMYYSEIKNETYVYAAVPIVGLDY